LANPVQDQILANSARGSLSAPKAIALPNVKPKNERFLPLGAMPLALSEQNGN
jgi:hypothetical protein